MQQRRICETGVRRLQGQSQVHKIWRVAIIFVDFLIGDQQLNEFITNMFIKDSPHWRRAT